MKNILLIMPYGSVGGMERLALHFYNYYKAQGYNVKAIKLIKLKTDIINFGDDEFYFSDRDFYQMSVVKRLLFYIIAPRHIRSIIQKEKITHSISFGDMTNVFSSLTFTNEFKVASIHALKSVEFNNNNILNKVFKFSFKTSYKHFNKVVCISKAIKKDLIEKCGYKFNNLEVIYNPHDLELIRNLAQENITDTFEKELFSKKVVLFLGRLSIQKAPWHLIKSFAILLKSNSDVNLVFIGDGDSYVENHLIQIINELNLKNKIYFLGRKSNPYKYLKKANVVALTSYYEGTPNVIVEAMALNIPIVSSNCTDGIGELMSLKEVIPSSETILVEAGIITPNFYKGAMNIPTNKSFTAEEYKFADALNLVLTDTEIQKTMIKTSENLTSKFNLTQVCNQYFN